MRRDKWDFYEDLGNGSPAATAAASPQQSRTEMMEPHAAPLTDDGALMQSLTSLYMKLYPYQRELVRSSALQDSFVYLQTGGGKTWVAATLVALHLVVHPNSRVFFVVRSVALADQQAQVLRQLTEQEVACINGGKKRFRSAEAFFQPKAPRVAVIVDAVFFKWLSESPELVTEQSVSLIILDEAHHAHGGAYNNICKLLFKLRDDAVQSSPPTDRRCMELAGRRSPAATVLASKLRSLTKAGTAAKEVVAEQEVRCLREYYPLDLSRPQLIGLSASPVVHFNGQKRELVKLLGLMRCRLVGVVDEVADLAKHQPNPSMLTVSFLPFYEERVLQTMLRSTLVQVLRRMEALVPETGKKRLDTLLNTPVISPAFIAACNMFITDVSMSPAFYQALRILPGSVLREQVLQWRQGSALHSVDSGSEATPLSLSRNDEEAMCKDFIHHGIVLLRSLSECLATLEYASPKAVVQCFYNAYPRERLKSMSAECGAITAVVLRPFLKDVFQLLRAVDMRAAIPTAPIHSPAVTREGATLAAKDLPECIQHLSSRTQILVRLFFELAVLATTVATTTAPAARDSATEQNLRVLVFVETRDNATDLLAIFDAVCPFITAALRPAVLVGQKGKKELGEKSMTRAQQTAVLDSFRAGVYRLVLATTVAEEGIDVPACHVVMRHHMHTELRDVVQCCGRLRMRRTLFVSLSNLLNGHPRLGYVLRCIANMETTLNRLAVRCRENNWQLDRDDLTSDGTAEADGNGFGYAADLLLANPNELARLSTQDHLLLARRRSIVRELQGHYKAEVYCVQSRLAHRTSTDPVSVHIKMSVPMCTSDRDDGEEEPHWVVVDGHAKGGAKRAMMRAFTNFCAAAKENGFFAENFRVRTPKERAEGMRESLWTSPIRCGDFCTESIPREMCHPSLYAELGTPCVILLGASMCLCDHTTWPVTVLLRLFSTSAQEMNQYNADLWSSPIHPPTLLREVLRKAGGDAPEFIYTDRRSGDHRCNSDTDALSTSRTCDLDVPEDYSARNTTTRVSTKYMGDSRSSYHTTSTTQDAPAQCSAAQVVFYVPASMMARLANEKVPPHSWRGETAAETLGVAESEYLVLVDEVEQKMTIEQGTDGTMKLRKVTISHSGLDAVHAVALKALRMLEVYVVYGIDAEMILTALSARRQVGQLQNE